jgi:hypothetical protein
MLSKFSQNGTIININPIEKFLQSGFIVHSRSTGFLNNYRHLDDKILGV